MAETITYAGADYGIADLIELLADNARLVIEVDELRKEVGDLTVGEALDEQRAMLNALGAAYRACDGVNPVCCERIGILRDRVTRTGKLEEEPEGDVKALKTALRDVATAYHGHFHSENVTFNACLRARCVEARRLVGIPGVKYFAGPPERSNAVGFGSGEAGAKSHRSHGGGWSC